MDPLTAFSLFTNILTTVDGAIRLAKSLKELHDSKTGFSSNQEKILEASKGLEACIETLSADGARVTTNQPHPLLDKVASECRSAIASVQDILNACRAKTGGPKALAVLKAVASSQKHKAEVEKLQAVLETRRQLLDTAIACATRSDISRVLTTISELNQRQSSIANKLSSLHDRLEGERGISRDQGEISSTYKEAYDTVALTTLLRSLRPDNSTTCREESVAEAYSKTYHWVLETPGPGKSQTNRHFPQWLRDGRGIFHVAGKPGAGKSTLMKYIISNRRTHEYLTEWATASSKELVVSKYYFWKYGSSDEHTVSGLYRGLVYEMCAGSPLLASLLFPAFWGKGLHAASATVTTVVKDGEVRSAFDRIFEDPEIYGRFRFCFFIDALDEFDGKSISYSALVRLLMDWTTRPPPTAAQESFIKLCVSSREESAIMGVLGDAPRLRLHEITQSDIRIFVTDALLENDHFSRLMHHDHNGCQNLLRDITRGAEGVFLWAALLMKQLEDELWSGVATLDSLRRIVDSTPAELEHFIMEILDSVPKHYRPCAYFMLAMALQATGTYITDDDALDLNDRSKLMEVISRSPMYGRLLAYGSQKATEAFQNGSLFQYNQVTPASLTVQEYTCAQITCSTKVRQWTRGLLEHMVNEYSRIKPFGTTTEDHFWRENDSVGVLIFGHRSIPDVLSPIMRRRATEFGLRDEVVTAGLVFSLTAEIATRRFTSSNLVQGRKTWWLRDLLRLVRFRTFSQSSLLFPMLDQLEEVNLSCEPDCGSFGPSDRFSKLRKYLRAFLGSIEIDVGRFASDHRLRISEWPATISKDRDLLTVWADASQCGLHEYIQWKLSRTSDLEERQMMLYSALLGISTALSTSRDHVFLRQNTTTLRLLFSFGAQIVCPMASQWFDEIWALKSNRAKVGPTGLPGPGFNFTDAQRDITFSSLIPVLPWAIGYWGSFRILDIDVDPRSNINLWSFLEIWLEYGAPIPEHMSVLGTPSGFSLYWTMFWKSPDGATLRRLRGDTFFSRRYGSQYMAELLRRSTSTSLTEIVEAIGPYNAEAILAHVRRNTIRKK